MANALGPVTTGLTYFGRQVLAQLKNKLVLVPACRQYFSGETVYGSIVSIPVLEPLAEAGTRVSGGAVTAQDVSAMQVPIHLQEIYSAIAIDNLDSTLANFSLLDNYAGRVAYTVAAKADKLVAGLWQHIPNEVGTVDGSAAFGTNTMANIAAAKKVLMDNQTPTDDLHLIMSTAEQYNFYQTSNLFKVNEAGDGSLLRSGAMGSILGFEIDASQQIQSGTETAVGVWGAAPLMVGAGVQGDTTVSVDALGAGTVKAGSSFKLKGHNYDVTADTAIVANAAVLPIYPALQTAVVDEDPLVAVSYTAAGSQNMAFHRDAIAVVTKGLAPLANNVTSTTVTDDQTGLSIRISMQSQLVGNPGMTTFIVADMVFGTEVVQPNYAVRITGA